MGQKPTDRIINEKGNEYNRKASKVLKQIPAIGFAASLFGTHEWVVYDARSVEGFLDGSGADPTDKVPDTSGLIVGARCATTSEGLLSDYCCGGFVVDAEVAGCIAEAAGRF